MSVNSTEATPSAAVIAGASTFGSSGVAVTDGSGFSGAVVADGSGFSGAVVTDGSGFSAAGFCGSVLPFSVTSATVRLAVKATSRPYSVV